MVNKEIIWPISLPALTEAGYRTVQVFPSHFGSSEAKNLPVAENSPQDAIRFHNWS